MIKNIKYFSRKIRKRVLYSKGISGMMNKKHILTSGKFGIISLETSNLTKNQLECIRIILKRNLKKKGTFLLKSNFNLSLTSKSAGVRMGKGRGGIKRHDMNIQKYQCFLEFLNISKPVALQCFKNIKSKLPFKLGLIDEKKKFIFKI